MIVRTPSHTGDETCPACIVAGGFVFLAHHSGGHEKTDAVFQAKASFNALDKTLRAVGSDLNHMVQLTLYLKRREDFPSVRNIFREYFGEGHYPARMTVFTNFINKNCLCMIDGIAVLKVDKD